MMYTNYATDDMIEYLEKYYLDNGYDIVEKYSDIFLPARVPLYCKKEIKVFSWDNDSEIKQYLRNMHYLSLTDEIMLNRDVNDNISISCANDKIDIIHHNKGEFAVVIKDNHRYRDLRSSKKQSGVIEIFDSVEVVIDITTERSISKDYYFHSLPISERTFNIFKLENTSPLIFYRYYFPMAYIYFAYPRYAEWWSKASRSKLEVFKDMCKKYQIGLLSVSKTKIKEVIRPQSLFNSICDSVFNNVTGNTNTLGVEYEIEKYLEEFLHNLIYYPDAVYKKQSIIGKTKDRISLALIDKLKILNKLEKDYRGVLYDLWHDYRHRSVDDYGTANKCINVLWRKRLGIEYPVIHMHMEDILQRNDKYKEHYVHQFQVFLLGIYIIDRLYNNDKYRKIFDSFNKINKCKIEDIWLAASTYHDFNYGIQEFDYWLMQFFSDTLYIDNYEAKDKLNILNLDAAMVREYLSFYIERMVDLLPMSKEKKITTRKYFYEKVVKDKNHGILSALSFMKLCESKISELGEIQINKRAVSQAALAMACHDEDVWEALSGCKGYLKNNSVCDTKKCSRMLSNGKQIEVQKYRIWQENNEIKCEKWESDLMAKNVMKYIEFEKWPVLFLLILCDSVQDEGRVTSKQIHTSKKEGNIREVKKKEMIIKLTGEILNEWADTEKIILEFKKKKKVNDSFNEVGYQISDDTRAFKYRTSNNKWKIIDGNKVYIIEYKKGKGYTIKRYPQEITLTDIKIDNKIIIKLARDNLHEKIAELERIAYVLKDENFIIHIEEKDTITEKDINIDGRGGG